MTKLNYSTKAAIVAGAVGLLATTGQISAQSSDALLNALIKKGILSETEAHEIMAENTTNITTMAASKWKLSNAIKDIQLFGDVRLRYEYRGVDNPEVAGLTKGDTYERERFRYAFRVGIRGDLFDDFNYGIRVETSTNPRSPWVSFGDDSSPTPSSKASDGIGIGQIYIGWHPSSWFEMTVGKMPMPLYITPMVWDSDINPEGAFEKFKYSSPNVDLFADFGQFMYQDTNPDVEIPSSDTFVLAWQVGANVKLAKDMSFKIAPVVYNYTGLGATAGLNKVFVGQGDNHGANPNSVALNQNGINDLLILEIPLEYNVKLGAYHVRAFGDFAYNFDGDDRARAAFAADPAAFSRTTPATGQNKAYQIGIGIGNEGPVYGPTQGLVYGSTSKKKTWEARVYWQHIEQYALDVNLIDSDFFEGRGNLEGFYASFAYSFTDGIIGTVRYGHADPINRTLGTGGNNLDIPGINPIQNYNLLQLDLTWRF